jgi:uncharacterized protein YcfJ
VSTYYELGRHDALVKLGMQLTFNSPQEAAAHAKTRGTIGDVTGFAGNIAGGIAGGVVGSAAGGPAGSLAGGLAGGYAGQEMLSAPATTAYDAAHDVKQRTGATYNKTMGQLNAASGVPTGVPAARPVMPQR